MKRLRELRQFSNLTQREVAEKLSTTQTTIGKYERGELQPSIETLIKLSELFECSIDYLLGREDDFGNITLATSSAPALSQEENNLLEDFRSLPRQEKAQATEYVHYLAQRRGQTKKA